MSAASHFRFGYAVQISSLLTLALVNIALPNWIGAQAFGRLNEATALVGFSCMVFNEGAALLIIRAIHQRGRSAALARNIAWQAAFEHAFIALGALAILIVATRLLAPGHTYGASDWGLVAVADLVVAAYACAVAWLTARLQNSTVAWLAILQGLSSFAFPLVAVKTGSDVRWAIAGSYVAGLGICLFLMWRVDRSPWRPALARTARVCLVPSLAAASAQTAMRTAFVWFPVLVLATRGDLAASAAYKIALSLALGVCAIVPYHRLTMLSLDGHGNAESAGQLATGAVLLASFGALGLCLLGRPVTALLYQVELGAVGQYLSAFGAFVVLQVFSDVLMVQLMATHDDRTLLWACGLAVATSALIAGLGLVAWLPVVSLAVFVTVVLWRLGSATALALPLRAALWGTATAAVASQIPTLGAAILALSFAAATLSLNTALRRALLATFAQMLGKST